MTRPTSPLRTLRIAVLALGLGVVMTGVAQLLLWLIEMITGLAFFGRLEPAGSPVGNGLGLAVVLVPVLGGLIVGLMARFGSPAIRGHGIPEAMEKILENESRIPARLTWMKPLSAAISIGTGGPFGAEGPIIATGGAGGSLLGQWLPVTPAERKTLLAAGAAAGMAATFGSPFSALLLAIELLLFEFHVRSLIPVSLAVSVAALLRANWVGAAPVFPMPPLAVPSVPAFAACLLLAALVGLIAFGISRMVYFVEDAFEKLPIHWMWWPALGAVAVGLIGFFEPRTLGVGYGNITQNLAGAGTLGAIGLLCFLKFSSWSISLGSGTSGGTLAPLMTLGSGLGWILGSVAQAWVPSLDPHLCALLGMACMFGGASQAMLASAVFACETTGQSAALFPLLAGCAVAVWVVRVLGRTSIMTEKIERRGVSVPSNYGANIFEHTRVGAVMESNPRTLSVGMTLRELADRIAARDPSIGNRRAYLLLDENDALAGLLTQGDLIRGLETGPPDAAVSTVATLQPVTVTPEDFLQTAIEKMFDGNFSRLPVVQGDAPGRLVGYLGRADILQATRKAIQENRVNRKEEQA